MIPNKEHIALWVEDLRRGKWIQGTGRLAQNTINETEYCCLGRGCEVAILGGVPLARDMLSSVHLYDQNAVIFPPRVSAWFGLASVPGLTCRNRDAEQTSLVELNDFGLTFSQIADLIEWEWLS